MTINILPISIIDSNIFTSRLPSLKVTRYDIYLNISFEQTIYYSKLPAASESFLRTLQYA